MFWFVNIGILILGYLANRAIAAYIASRQKPPTPGPFSVPTIAAGQCLTVSYGTTRGEATVAGVYDVKLVEVVHDTLDNVFRIGSRTTLGYQYKVSLLYVLGWGHVRNIANIMFGEKALSDQPLTQQWDLGDGVSITVPTFGVGGSPQFVSAAIGSPAGAPAADVGALAVCQLFLPNIFGGRGRGGGFTAAGGDRNNPYGGFIRFYRGARNTGPDAALEALLGAGNVPNWNDLSYIVLDDVNVGEQTTPPSIQWIFFREKIPQFPHWIYDNRINDRAIPGRYWNWRCVDANPVAMLLDILTNPSYGQDQPNHVINWGDTGLSRGISGMWRDAFAALAAEGLGMSLRFAGTREAADAAIKEIERTVDGQLTRDPVTFQWSFKLNRDEATTVDEFNALREFTPEEIVSLTPLNQQLWSETLNVLTVEFSDAERFFNKNTVTLRNHANIAMTGEEREAPNIQYHGITDRATALRLCARDLKKLSIPLWKGRMQVSRDGWDLERGDVFKLTYQKYDFAQKLMRVVSVDFGEETDGTITVDVIEDVFHYPDIVRPENVPPTPATNAPIIRPTITAAVASSPTPSTGRITINLLDPQRRTYEIAYRTTIGTDAPGAWIVTGTATPDTTAPFPYNDPVTDTDVSGAHAFDVALSPLGPSVIDVRVRYIAYGTVADPTSGFGEILTSYPFSAILGTATQTLDGADNPLIWDVTGRPADAASVVIDGSRSLVIIGAEPGFRGTLLVTSVGGTGYTLTLPAGSLIGDGSSLDVTLSVKDSLSVYYDGTYFWWNVVSSISTLPPIPLAASLAVSVSAIGTLDDLSASLSFEGTTTGDLSI